MSSVTSLVVSSDKSFLGLDEQLLDRFGSGMVRVERENFDGIERPFKGGCSSRSFKKSRNRRQSQSDPSAGPDGCRRGWRWRRETGNH